MAFAGAPDKLNLGSGAFPKEGFLNVDIDPALKPDVIHDLNVFPYPFRSNTFSRIEADHVLEHLENPFTVMKEVHRILVPGGVAVVRVPHHSRGFTHPDHKHGFDLSFPYYFLPTFKGGYAGVHFALIGQKLSWFAQPYLKKDILSPIYYIAGVALGSGIDFFANLWPELCSRVWCYWVGGFEELEFMFEAQK